MSDIPGLRERKKQATREALRLAALHLATQKPWDQVRVEDIAAEAGVSSRTFSNYFATKEDAFLATAHDRAARVKAALLARPAAEPLWSALIHAVTAGFANTDDQPDLRRSRQIKPTPTLAGEHLKAFAVVEQVLAEGIAERIGVDAGRDLYPRLVAGAVVTVTRVATAHAERTQPDQPVETVVRDALERLAAGLPWPAAETRSPG